LNRTILAFGLLCAATPVFSQTIYERLDGRLFGTVQYKEMSCDTNPTTISFSDDLLSATFTSMHPIEDDLGVLRQEWSYSVKSSSRTYVTLLLNGETRLDEDGRPLNWKFYLRENATMCWQRADRPNGPCRPVFETCTGS